MSTRTTIIIKLDSYARTDNYLSFKSLFYDPQSPTCKPTLEGRIYVEKLLVAAIDTGSCNIVNFLMGLLENLKVYPSVSLILRAIRSNNNDDIYGITILDRLFRHFSLGVGDVNELIQAIFTQRKYLTLIYLIKTNKIDPSKLNLDRCRSKFLSDLQSEDTAFNCTILIHIFRKHRNLSDLYTDSLRTLKKNYHNLKSWMVDPIKLILSKQKKTIGDDLVLIDEIIKQYFTTTDNTFENYVVAEFKWSFYILECLVGKMDRFRLSTRINSAKVMRFIKLTITDPSDTGRIGGRNHVNYQSIIICMWKIFDINVYKELLESVSNHFPLDAMFYYSWINPEVPELFKYPDILERVLYSHRNDVDLIEVLNNILKIFLHGLKFDQVKVFKILLDSGANPFHKFISNELTGLGGLHIEVFYLTMMCRQKLPPEILELALSRDDVIVNYFDEYFGMSLLRYIALTGSLNDVKKLVKLGAVVDDLDLIKVIELLEKYPNHPNRRQFRDHIDRNIYLSYTDPNFGKDFGYRNRSSAEELDRIREYLADRENIIPSLVAWSGISITRFRVNVQKLPWVLRNFD